MFPKLILLFVLPLLLHLAHWDQYLIERVFLIWFLQLVLEVIDGGQVVYLLRLALYKLVGFAKVGNLPKTVYTVPLLHFRLLSGFFLGGVVLDGTVFDVIVFLYEWVKPVFDFVLRSARQLLADLRPASSNLRIKPNYLPVLLVSPVFPFDFGVQLVDESLSYLLACLGA